ncbi:GNAT family N-acetyltransferase [Dyella sp. LX-66]|uniref:GNAT family N-acetyltransferase n=1 Tax=unclassified Dyella TaxID=2634549 RepID=UPI001BE022D5|nr:MULTISPECIES: GNAT family protein [unclassified Dyella]MBT2118435.1 GNAT family N-acetyltransferase [Dyella sp. LX-1]MBT2141893.1 GNAT family N-acetyltransferase [Dyella sp. LX-66]
MSQDHAPWPSFPLPPGPLRVRPWQPEDADALFAAASESIDSVGRWLPWCREGYVRQDSVAWIAHAQGCWQLEELFAFAIVDETDGSVAGGVGLNQFNRQHRSANLGYWVRQSCQGQGIAPRAVPAVARFGFETLGLVRVEIVAAVDNLPSRRCAEKAGARFEGIGRQRLIIDDTAMDAAVYALIPSDLA